ncbi:sensor histidine kinase [Anaerosporobacter faecicola]|uniref:sensor histidine kinase n=1 Tax=Anaerosporobacter faecicola TaxID=2718714 RepID=UPI001439B844|nr:histidine kinase [Anaerosporobacter faecicola]
MTEIIDKLILLALSSTFCFMHFNSTYSIVYLLLVLILTCLSTITEKQQLHVGIFVLYLIASSFYPILLYYLPVMVYDVFTVESQSAIVFAIIPFIINFDFYYSNHILFFFVMVLIGLLIKYRSEQAQNLITEYNHLRDDTKELEIILEKQNQTLLDNQDIEITAAMLSERNRISKEIHDNIGHLLSRSLLQIGALLTITKEEITRETLTSLRDSISEGMDSIRNSIHNMHDDSIDLYNAIYKLTSEFTFCHISFIYDLSNQPDAKVKSCLISIVKEALNNIIKHSNATNVSVKLLEHPAMYQLIISDNGTLTSTVKWYLSQNKTGDGMGLQSMADRIKSFQGNFNILTDHGFEIFITIPKQEGV